MYFDVFWSRGHFEMSKINGCLDLTEIFKLPEKPPKNWKDQIILGNSNIICLVAFKPVCGENTLYVYCKYNCIVLNIYPLFVSCLFK